MALGITANVNENNNPTIFESGSVLSIARYKSTTDSNQVNTDGISFFYQFLAGGITESVSPTLPSNLVLSYNDVNGRATVSGTVNAGSNIDTYTFGVDAQPTQTQDIEVVEPRIAWDRIEGSSNIRFFDTSFFDDNSDNFSPQNNQGLGWSNTTKITNASLATGQITVQKWDGTAWQDIGSMPVNGSFIYENNIQSLSTCIFRSVLTVRRYVPNCPGQSEIIFEALSSSISIDIYNYINGLFIKEDNQAVNTFYAFSDSTDMYLTSFPTNAINATVDSGNNGYLYSATSRSMSNGISNSLYVFANNLFTVSSASPLALTLATENVITWEGQGNQLIDGEITSALNTVTEEKPIRVEFVGGLDVDIDTCNKVLTIDASGEDTIPILTQNPLLLNGGSKVLSVNGNELATLAEDITFILQVNKENTNVQIGTNTIQKVLTYSVNNTPVLIDTESTTQNIADFTPFVQLGYISNSGCGGALDVCGDIVAGEDLTLFPRADSINPNNPVEADNTFDSNAPIGSDAKLEYIVNVLNDNGSEGALVTTWVDSTKNANDGSAGKPVNEPFYFDSTSFNPTNLQFLADTGVTPGRYLVKLKVTNFCNSFTTAAVQFNIGDQIKIESTECGKYTISNCSVAETFYFKILKADLKEISAYSNDLFTINYGSLPSSQIEPVITEQVAGVPSDTTFTNGFQLESGESVTVDFCTEAIYIIQYFSIADVGSPATSVRTRANQLIFNTCRLEACIKAYSIDAACNFEECLTGQDFDAKRQLFDGFTYYSSLVNPFTNRFNILSTFTTNQQSTLAEADKLLDQLVDICVDLDCGNLNAKSDCGCS